MNLSQLTSSQLRNLTKLAEAKEGLLAKVAHIDRQLAAVEPELSKSLSGPAQKPAPKRRAQKRAKPGRVKNAIIHLLKQGGKGGVTVREIAAKLGLSVNRIHTWFSGARKTMKQIKKLGPGKYAWAE